MSRKRKSRRGNHGQRRGLHLPRLRKPKPGTAPGIEHHDIKNLATGPAGKVYISCTDYCPDNVRMTDVVDLDPFLAQHRPEWSQVRWINVDGLTDMKVIEALAKKYQLHPLSIEDMLHVPQRPKMEAYAAEGESLARIFLIARMIQLREGHLHTEQISIFLGRKTVLTFQETHGDVWDPIRERIHKTGSRLRQNDASFLVYALLDAVVDHCFPILEYYGDKLEEMEDQILEEPSQESIHQIHGLKRELLLLRREVWPMRELVLALQREPHECMSENTRTYLTDVYDHTVQAIDIIETYREVATALAETHMTAMSNRMNEVMKVLTIIATIFIPITFLAGVYGMNMPIPENHSKYAYPLFWIVCLSVAVGMLGWFRRRKWI